MPRLVAACLALGLVLPGAGCAADEEASAPGPVAKGRSPQVAPAVTRAEEASAAGPRLRGDGARLAARTVRSWDDRRSAAWARGDVVALGRLYTPVSSAGRRDVAALRSWRARGVSLSGADLDLLAVRVLGRAPGEWRLVVTDRLRPPVAEVDGVRLRLPADLPSRRLVRLVREPGRHGSPEAGVWRVAALRPVRSSAPRRRHGRRT